ncbi:UbiA prenyltransferase family protein [Ichthyenterobacterium magnum]|uniref:UbiA prenyltransferase family protein n=1 Tax=Ichthyenterobacterium magnum TaxID=1230530 RepID=A0A420DFL6_9FLAO|nr:hypothetical protein [Ichthyenterobacterium magnum]RKE90986.1 hypothetical protein BXY80_2576 [Ichthyenterobacterium magnum]
MKVLKHVFNFYINSSVHVALSVYALSWITLIELDIMYDENVLYFIFYATITGYNFVKYFGLAKFHHRSLADWLKVIQIFSLLCFVMLCYYAIKLETNTLLTIVLFGVITFLYAIPFLPKRIFLDSQQNLRSISGLKIYVIGLVWSGVTVCLPLLNNDYIFDVDVVITALQRFLFVIVLMFPFEIRDLKYDSLKLSTIPQSIGVKRTKTIGVLLLAIFLFLEFLKDDIDSKRVIIHFIITLITLMLLLLARKNQGQYYSSFWVESIPIIWLVLILIM